MKKIRFGIKIAYIITLVLLLAISSFLVFDVLRKNKKILILAKENRKYLELLSQINIEKDKAQEIIDFLDSSREDNALEITNNPFTLPVVIEEVPEPEPEEVLE